MFSSKDLKVKLVYMGFGGMIAIVGMLFAFGMLSSVTAQKDKFGDIECTSLRIINANDIARVFLGTDLFQSGRVSVYGIKEGQSKVEISNVEHGGHVGARGIDGESEAVLSIGGGGRVNVSGKDGQPVASLSCSDHGGRVVAYGKVFVGWVERSTEWIAKAIVFCNHRSTIQFEFNKKRWVTLHES